jgi:hypothetical protein
LFDNAQNFLKRSTVNFVRKLIALASCAANGCGEMELGRESKKNFVLLIVGKAWEF